MSRYASGANFERKVVNDEINKGAWLVLRGAGSKSKGIIKVDVISFREDVCYLIQCKKGKSSYKKESKVFNSAKIPENTRVVRRFIVKR